MRRSRAARARTLQIALGYTGDGYATRDGAQIRAVAAMPDRLASAR